MCSSVAHGFINTEVAGTDEEDVVVLSALFLGTGRNRRANVLNELMRLLKPDRAIICKSIKQTGVFQKCGFIRILTKIEVPLFSVFLGYGVISEML